MIYILLVYNWSIAIKSLKVHIKFVSLAHLPYVSVMTANIMYSIACEIKWPLPIYGVTISLFIPISSKFPIFCVFLSKFIWFCQLTPYTVNKWLWLTTHKMVNMSICDGTINMFCGKYFHNKKVIVQAGVNGYLVI